MSEIWSVDEREEEFLKLISLKGTIDILRYLNEHGTAQYKDLIELVNEVTLYNRVKQLLKFDLIIHCLDKKDVRREWYEITEKGRKVLQILGTLKKLGEDINLEDIHKNIENSGGAPG